MPVEIERKFLLNSAEWEKLEKPAGNFYRQGYLSNEPAKTIRVRQTDDKGYLTIKGLSVGAARAEYEYEIPHSEAGELLDKFAVSELSKLRYKIMYGGKLWEVDEFKGDNAGLLVAEIELSSEDEKFDLPPWIGEEVTGEEKYYNSNLSVRPYSKW